MALVWAGGIVYDQYEENRNSRIGAEISTESVDPDSSGLASPYDYWDGNDRSAPRAGEKQPRSLQKSRRNRQVDRQSRTSGPEEEHTESEEERIQRELERHRKEARALEELAISEFDAASKRDERRRQRNKAAIIRAASRADTGERHSGRNKRAGSSRTAGKGGSGNHGRSQEPREQRKVSESGSGQGGKGTEGDTDSPETETGHGGSYAAAGKQTEEREDCESEASHAASRRYTLLSGDEDSGNGWEPGGGTDTGAEDDPGQAGDTGGGGNETYLLEEHKTFTVYSEVGYVVPAAGEHLILEDYEVAAWVKYDTERVGDTRYRCAGWTGTGDVPGSGNGDSVTFTMSQDSSITWNWTKEYLLDTGVSGSGSVDTADKWCEPGKVMQITAAPSRGWLFSHWSGDVTSESNPLSVRMNRPLEVTAVFEEERPDDGNSAPAPVYMDTDTTWSSGQPHYLSAPVIVRNGATLTIEPGAVIRSEPSGSLVIARGSRIEAMGTREAPIVMTDLHDDHMVGTDPSPGTYPYNLRNNGIGGRWGGLILLGDAFVTTDAGEPDVYSPDPSLELELDGYEDIGAFYGGGDDNDGSGELHFVSIRYAGLAPDGKGRVPGLTLAGVGRNTTVDNVEVFQCAGDGFSFLGGTVGTRYLQSWSAGGDAFHWDYGYRGKGQFWFGLQGILSSIGEVSDKACEMRGGPGQALLSSCPTIHNATFIGLGADSGNQGNTCLHFADGSGGRFRNMIAMDFGGAVALIEGSPSNSIYDASDNCYNSYFHDPLYSHVYAGSRILEIEGSFFWNFGFGNAKGLPLDSAFAGEWGAAYDARGPYHGLETGFDLIESGVMNCYQNGSAGYRSPLKQIEFEQQPVSVHGHEYYPISHIDPRIRDRRYIKAGWRASAVDEFFTPVCFQGAFHKDNWADWTAAAGLGMLATEGINADDYEQTGPDHFVMEIRRDSDFVSFQMDIDSVLEGTLVELFVFYRRSDDGRLYFYDFTTGRWHYRGTRSKAMALGDLELRNILDVRAPDADGGLGASPLPPDSEVHMYIDLRPNGLCDYPWLGAEHERLGDLQPDHS
jgi:hypothetical protein